MTFCLVELMMRIHSKKLLYLESKENVLTKLMESIKKYYVNETMRFLYIFVRFDGWVLCETTSFSINATSYSLGRSLRLSDKEL